MSKYHNTYQRIYQEKYRFLDTVTQPMNCATTNLCGIKKRKWRWHSQYLEFHTHRTKFQEFTLKKCLKIAKI
jgi:hypothetical protein